MFISLLYDAVFGILLTAIWYYFLSYCWFFASPFNQDWLKVLFKRENYTLEYPFNSYPICFTFVIISFAIQLAIPFGCVTLKQFLTSQLSLLDVILITVVPAIYMTSIQAWTLINFKDDGLDLKLVSTEVLLGWGGFLAICFTGGTISYLLCSR